MAESVQDQGQRAGADVMAAEDGEAAQAVVYTRSKKPETELCGVRRKYRGERVASKEQCAGTVSADEEATGKVDGARRAVKKKNMAALKKKGVRAGNFSTAEEAAGKLGGVKRAVRKKMAARRPEARTEFRGVSRRGINGKYGAQITHSKGIVQWLGTFDTPEEAARAYDAAAVELHGSRAVTNFQPMGESSGQATGSVMKVRKPAAPRPDAWTEFRGVSRSLNNTYGARIWDSKGKCSLMLGTFGTAVEAARAYDAAAVELHGASAVTNFMASDERSGQAAGKVKKPAAGSVKMKVEKPAAARPDAMTEFRGVSRQPSGKYRARIRDQKMKCAVSLGTFGTAVEAARAYDAAAVKLHGAAARTNFEQQPVDLLDDFAELPALEFSESLIPGPQMGDLRTELPPAEWELVLEFLKDFTDVVA
nr:AP2-like ethylene-responsive transcription factor AIL5 [Lolium perenne]